MSSGEPQGEQQAWIPPAVPDVSTVADMPTVPAMPAAETVRVVLPTQRLIRSDEENQPTINLSAPAPGELLRFGPGVPVPSTIADLSQATAVWRGEMQPAEGDGNADDDFTGKWRRRLLASWLLPVLVLLAVLAILLWQRPGTPLTVTNVTIDAASPTLTCDGTATVTATLRTNGADGTITYRWRRSDGTASDTLREQAAKGSTVVHVVLLWSFHGHGTMNATATLDVLSPSQLSTSTVFVYSCS